MTDKCKKCHRVIKNPLSVTHGYGPSCWKKVQHMIKQELEQRKEDLKEKV